MPYFSIITPMYNRAPSIGRAIESCLAQELRDFELLIVDDGSVDDSVAAAAAYRDPRIRLFRHDRNRGPCPARNTAIAQATGEWCVMLDSDFALLPGALERLRGRTLAASADVGNVASSCVWDTGEKTPRPAIDRVLDYTGYLQWAERVEISESFNCIRRDVFREFMYPDSRAWEFEFHAGLALRWTINLSSEAAVTIYTDASNRLTADRSPDAHRRLRADATDRLRSLESILRQHGPAMARWAPRLLADTRAQAAHQAFLAGRRVAGARHLVPTLMARPLSIDRWGLLAVGLIGPGVAARATVHQRRRR